MREDNRKHLDAFVESCNSIGLTSRTVDIYQKRITDLLEFTGDKPVDVGVAREHIKSLGMKSSTQRTVVSCYNSFFRSMGKTWRLEMARPVRKTKTYYDKPLVDLLFTEMATLTYNNVLNLRNLAILHLLYDSLLKPKAIVGLKVKDLPKYKGELEFLDIGNGNHVYTQEIGSIVSLYLKSDTQNLRSKEDYVFLNRYGTPLAINSITTIFSHLSERVDNHITPTAVRNTGIARLLDSGVDFMVLKCMAGFSSVTSVEAYATGTPGHMEELSCQVEKLGLKSFGTG